MKFEPVAAMLPVHSAFDSTNGDNRTKHGVHRYKYAIRAGFRVVSFLSVLAVFSVYNYLQSADVSSFPERRLSATDSEIYDVSTQHRSLDIFQEEADPKILLLPYIIGILYLFLAIAIVCDEFFIPALEVMVDEEHLNVSPDIAGATFMAAGGSAPELFTSFIGTFQESEVGIGTIVGSAVFNVLFVIGMCSIFSLEVLQLSWWPLFRDCTYYVISLFVLAIFVGVITEGEIHLWESIILFVMYIGYVLIMTFNTQLHKLITGKELEPDCGEEGSHNKDSPINFGSPRNFRAGLLTFIRDQNTWQTKARLGFLYGLSGNFDDVFENVDSNGDGHIDKDEMRNCFEDLGTSVDDSELSAIMEDIDSDGNHKVTKMEFKKWYLSSEQHMTDKIKVVFDEFDEDNSNTISKTEFICMLGNVDPTASEEVKDNAVHACFDEANKTALSFEDFTEWYFESLLFTQHKDNISAADKDDELTVCQKVMHPKDGTIFDYVKWAILFPIVATLSLTIPDCTQKKWANWCYFAFVMAIAWIGIYSYFMVGLATTVGATLGIPDFIMGLTFLAAGTSVPDLLSSVIVARMGRGDMAVSSSIGSNIFDILVGLPVPWIVFTLWPNDIDFVTIGGDGIWTSILILVGMIVLVIGVIHFQGWKLTKTLAYVMFAFYFLFLVQAILQHYL